MKIKRTLAEKVLMIGDYAGPDSKGGMATVIKNYLPYFEYLDYVYTWKPSDNKFFKMWLYVKAFIKVFLKLTFNRKIKVVHIHTCSGISFWRSFRFVQLSKCFNKQVLLHIHGGRFPEFYDHSDRKKDIVGAISKADRLLVLTESWKEWYVSIGVNAEMVTVLNNMVIPIEPVEVSKGTRLNILFLGNLTKEKGIFDLLQVMAENKEYLRSRVMLKIGGTMNEDEICQSIISEGISDFVEFCGYVSGNDKAYLLNWCDVLVMPSYFECLPMSILEAMTCSKVIIASNVGGIPTVVKDRKNGILIEPGDNAAMIEAIKTFVERPELLKPFGECSRKLVESYLPDKIVSVLISLYEGLC